MMGVIVGVVILIVAIIGGIIYMVSKQEQSKGKLGKNIEIDNDILILDVNENLCLTGSLNNNSVIISDTIAKIPQPDDENAKKMDDHFQRWSGTSNNQLKRKNVNLCLDIAGNKFIAGSQIIQNPCSDALTQKWAFSDNSQIQSKTKPNLCMGVNVIEKNQKLELQECNNSNNQKWALLTEQ